MKYAAIGGSNSGGLPQVFVLLGSNETETIEESTELDNRVDPKHMGRLTNETYTHLITPVKISGLNAMEINTFATARLIKNAIKTSLPEAETPNSIRYGKSDGEALRFVFINGIWKPQQQKDLVYLLNKSSDKPEHMPALVFDEHAKLTYPLSNSAHHLALFLHAHYAGFIDGSIRMNEYGREIYRDENRDKYSGSYLFVQQGAFKSYKGVLNQRNEHSRIHKQVKASFRNSGHVERAKGLR